jgi:hypothetical protein
VTPNHLPAEEERTEQWNSVEEESEIGRDPRGCEDEEPEQNQTEYDVNTNGQRERAGGASDNDSHHYAGRGKRIYCLRVQVRLINDSGPEDHRAQTSRDDSHAEHDPLLAQLIRQKNRERQRGERDREVEEYERPAEPGREAGSAHVVQLGRRQPGVRHND